MNQNQKLQIDALRENGYGYKRIADKLDISVNTVSSYCRRKAKNESEKCPQCGKKLLHTPKHKKKRFCCDHCRMAWWNSHPYAVKRKPTWQTCKQCGMVFDAHYNRSRKFCSRDCYADFRRKGGQAS